MTQLILFTFLPLRQEIRQLVEWLRSLIFNTTQNIDQLEGPAILTLEGKLLQSLGKALGVAAITGFPDLLAEMLLHFTWALPRAQQAFQTGEEMREVLRTADVQRSGILPCLQPGLLLQAPGKDQSGNADGFPVESRRSQLCISQS